LIRCDVLTNNRAVVATVETADHNSTAWQRFLPNGPVALLPCHGPYSNIVWSTTLAHAHHLCTNISPQQFVEDLNNAFHSAPHTFQPSGR
jgi:2-polyprenyl-6-methoxyphenol hydroxylase-like FAD-dependent oxidoreductase